MQGNGRQEAHGVFEKLSRSIQFTHRSAWLHCIELKTAAKISNDPLNEIQAGCYMKSFLSSSTLN